ncbi:MAG: Smr/MutS family protein [Bacteroidales bacterium]|nr:Smr/MutS family protein [Bacteroidales bacterium]
MIYPKNFEEKTGFDQVRQMIRENCLSPLGGYYVDKIKFFSDFNLINKLLSQAEEFRLLLLEDSGFPAQDYFDLTPELQRIKIEGTYIEKDKLFDLKSSLITITANIEYIKKLDALRFPNLKQLTSNIGVEKIIILRIEKIIDNKGKIKDTASQKLLEIRKELIRKQSSIDKKINQSLKAAKRSGWVADDAEVTIRNGRMVIPMAAAYKRKIRGFIHDESATGQTVYLEPEEIFDINNEIRELENAERREIIQVLKIFTNFIRPQIPELLEAYRFLGLIDFIRAKAKFAIKINALKPDLSDKTLIDWESATHPLLYLSHLNQQKPVVPLDIQLNEKQKILVISGPNAGGKSVCLKTIGLLQYMVQCGLLIPVKEGSATGIFKKLFIDIGDEQSLENDLSTYSSHLLNMKHFVLQADKNTLFLIDEFGTGTEPQLGGSIAEAVLEKLNEKKAFGVVTTHYSNLKLLANEGNKIVNGAMLFDTKAMQPLYQLKIGKPGSSFAFEIARKIGFPKYILKNAGEKTGKKQLNFDEQLQQLEIEKKELEKKQQEFRIADDFLSEMIDKYNNLTKQVEATKDKIFEDARKEAHELIESSNKLIENTIRHIKESQAEKEKTKKLRKELKEKGERIKTEIEAKAKEEMAAKDSDDIAKKDKAPVIVGDFVKIVDQDVTGEVIEIKDEDVVITFNSVTFRTTLDKLKKVSKKEAGKLKARNRKTGYSNILNEKMANFNLQVDIRGKRGEDALSIVKQYINDAILLNISEVKILHGKGYGILRTLIHDYLRSIPDIKSFKDEHIERGGHGITIVRF